MKELAATLDVGASTIQRDLQALARTGNVERVNVGLRLPLNSDPQSSPTYAATSHQAIAAPTKIFLKRGETVNLGAELISDRLGQMIVGIPDLTRHTNSPRLAYLLSRNGIHVYLAGGEIRPGDS